MVVMLVAAMLPNTRVPPHGGGDVRIHARVGVLLIISGLPKQELTFLRRSFTERGAMGRKLMQAKLAS